MPINLPPIIQYADISQWQTSFDPATYFASGYSKVSIRATYGTTGTDPLFAARWEACSGHTRQAYSFAYPGDGAAQARHFLDTVNTAGGFQPGDEAMLDLEQLGVTPDQAGQITPAWIQTVHAAAPDIRLFVYGNEWFIAAAGLTSVNLPNVGLIVAAYPGPPLVPPGWDHVCIHQYADNEVVPGFPSPVDINRIICPSGLNHLTYGDDMSQADIDAINTHVDNAMRFWFTNLIGTRAQPAGINPETPTSLASLADGLYVSYHGIKDDPTHPGQVDLHSQLSAVTSAVSAVESRVANITQAGGAIDPQLAADIQNLITALNGGLSWTVTTKAGS